VIGLFKIELIKRRGPWRAVEPVEIPPAELEAARTRQHAALTEAGHSTP
jgi:hypothetical protein